MAFEGRLAKETKVKCVDLLQAVTNAILCLASSLMPSLPRVHTPRKLS